MAFPVRTRQTLNTKSANNKSANTKSANSKSAAKSTPRQANTKTPNLSLQVVPARRRLASVAVFTILLLSTSMIAAVLLRTRVAERQLEIDRLNTGVRETQEEFDALRAERAELRAPNRLAGVAANLGMEPGQESEFIQIDPMVLARSIAATGQIPGQTELVVGAAGSADPLDQFRLVKQTGAEAP